ncbi:MAG: nucleotide exchange factor GrpE [Promethearchaeota archaeon]
MAKENDDDIKEKATQEASAEENITSKEKVTTQPSSEGGSKSEEVKRLEEKEHYELDYFSKEDLVKKNEDLEKELGKHKESVEKLQKVNVDSKNKYMKLQADFENAQKRWDKNRQNLRIEYTASVLKNFLPLYDSFKKAIDSDKANETEKNILTGFYNQFMNIFKSYGVEPIQVKINDPFDYSIHEALSTVEKEDIPENSIIEIVQDGFKYGKEVIRYAKVIISRKPKPPEPEPEEEKIEEKKKEQIIESQETLSDKKVLKEEKLKEKKSKKEKKKDIQE